MSASADLCYCGRPAGHTGRHKNSSLGLSKTATAVAPSKRVSIQLTEAQLNKLILSWPIEQKAQLVNLILNEEANGHSNGRPRSNGVGPRHRKG